MKGIHSKINILHRGTEIKMTADFLFETTGPGRQARNYTDQSSGIKTKQKTINLELQFQTKYLLKTKAKC